MNEIEKTSKTFFTSVHTPTHATNSYKLRNVCKFRYNQVMLMQQKLAPRAFSVCETDEWVSRPSYWAYRCNVQYARLIFSGWRCEGCADNCHCQMASASVRPLSELRAAGHDCVPTQLSHCTRSIHPPRHWSTRRQIPSLALIHDLLFLPISTIESGVS